MPFSQPIKAELIDRHVPLPVETIAETGGILQQRADQARQVEGQLERSMRGVEPEMFAAPEDVELTRGILSEAEERVRRSVEEGHYEDLDLELMDIAMDWEQQLETLQQPHKALQSKMEEIEGLGHDPMVENFLKRQAQEAFQRGVLERDERGILRARTGEIEATPTPEPVDIDEKISDFASDVEHDVMVQPLVQLDDPRQQQRQTQLPPGMGGGIESMLRVESGGPLATVHTDVKSADKILHNTALRLFNDPAAREQLLLEFQAQQQNVPPEQRVDPTEPVDSQTVTNPEATEEEIRHGEDIQEQEISAFERYVLNRVSPYAEAQSFHRPDVQVHSNTLRQAKSSIDRGSQTHSNWINTSIQTNLLPSYDSIGELSGEIQKYQDEKTQREDALARKIAHETLSRRDVLKMDDPGMGHDILDDIKDAIHYNEDGTMQIDYNKLGDVSDKAIREIDVHVQDLESKNIRLQEMKNLRERVRHEADLPVISANDLDIRHISSTGPTSWGNYSVSFKGEASVLKTIELRGRDIPRNLRIDPNNPNDVFTEEEVREIINDIEDELIADRIDEGIFDPRDVSIELSKPLPDDPAYDYIIENANLLGTQALEGTRQVRYVSDAANAQEDLKGEKFDQDDLHFSGYIDRPDGKHAVFNHPQLDDQIMTPVNRHVSRVIGLSQGKPAMKTELSQRFREQYEAGGAPVTGFGFSSQELSHMFNFNIPDDVSTTFTVRETTQKEHQEARARQPRLHPNFEPRTFWTLEMEGEPDRAPFVVRGGASDISGTALDLYMQKYYELLQMDEE